MNKRHYEHTLPNIRGSLSNTYLFFSVIPDKDEESVGIKTIAFRCIQILHFVQNNSFISERQIFTETQVYFRVTVSFQKYRSL